MVGGQLSLLYPEHGRAILLLAFIVYAVKKYRTRKILREWEASEKPGNIIDFTPFPPDDD